MDKTQKVAIWISTGFGAGYFPKAPGTAGAAVGIPLGLILDLLSPVESFCGLVLLTLLGFWASGVAERTLKEKDPAVVVIDEVIGMAISMWAIEPSWLSVALLFFLFRLFDIWKPFPVKNMEEVFSGGIGIVMDDVMAGIYANILWRMGSSFFS